MENGIIIGLLVVVLVLALLRARKHFQGGCCSSGSQTIRQHKELTEPIIGKKVLHIDGMHCENCQIRVENALNRFDGVVCRVNRRKKTALVSYSREPDIQQLRAAVDRLGYTVTGVEE